MPDVPAPGEITSTEARLARQHQADAWQAIAAVASARMSEPHPVTAR